MQDGKSLKTKIKEIMKIYIKILLLSIITCFASSCLEAGLEDLPEFEENSIVGVQGVKFRFISDETSNASEQNIVKYVQLGKSAEINEENAYIRVKVTVPTVSSNFPESARQECTLNNICVMVSLSTAARIFPIGNAPVLGTPSDWSKPNKYQVVAANGDKREWTIEIIEFVK